MAEALKRSPNLAQNSRVPKPESGDGLDVIVKLVGREIDTEVKVGHLTRTLKRVVKAPAGNRFRKRKAQSSYPTPAPPPASKPAPKAVEAGTKESPITIDDDEDATTQAPLSVQEDGPGVAGQNGDRAAQNPNKSPADGTGLPDALGLPDLNRTPQQVDLQIPEFLDDAIYVAFRTCGLGEGADVTVSIKKSIMLKFSGLLQREHAHRPINKLRFKRYCTKACLVHVAEVLNGKKPAMLTSSDPTSSEVFIMIEAALFFEKWEIELSLASTLAWLIFYFLEQKKCPNDLLLTTIWQLSRGQAKSLTRDIMLASVWYRVFFDEEDLSSFWTEYSRMYRTQDHDFVDVRPFSWFADFHDFCKPYGGTLARELFEQMQDTQGRGKKFKNDKDHFIYYVLSLRSKGVLGQLRTGLALDDDVHIEPCLSDFDRTDINKYRVDRLHIEHLKALQLQKRATGALFEPLYKDPCTSTEGITAAPPSPAADTQARRAVIEGPASRKEAAASKVTASTESVSSVVQQTAPSATEYAPATPIGPADALMRPPARSASLPDAAPSQRRHGNQKGALSGYLGSLTARKTKKRAAIARDRGVPVANIKDDHPLMLAAFSSIAKSVPGKHPRAASVNLESPYPLKSPRRDQLTLDSGERHIHDVEDVDDLSGRAGDKLAEAEPPKSSRRNEPIEDSKQRRGHSVEDGDEQSRRVGINPGINPGNAKPPRRGDYIPRTHYVRDPISITIPGNFTLELPFAGLKEHSALYSRVASSAEVKRPLRLDEQLLTKRAVDTLEMRLSLLFIPSAQRSTFEHHVDYVLATIVLRAEELEVEALRDFKEWWQEPFLYSRVIGAALTKAVKLGQRGKKLRALMADKAVVEAPTPFAWAGILTRVWNEEGELADKVFELDLLDAAGRLWAEGQLDDRDVPLGKERKVELEYESLPR